jgi:hypothetical protein
MAGLLALDPGAHGGWAIYWDGQLRDAGLFRWPQERPVRPEGAFVVCEQPSHAAVDVRDVIQLSIRVGRIVEWYYCQGVKVDLVEPGQWKGSTPKEIHHQRVARALRPRERERAEALALRVAASYRHNVWDAIGLGLWWLGREGLR